jgi:hypothetical protein
MEFDPRGLAPALGIRCAQTIETGKVWEPVIRSAHDRKA